MAALIICDHENTEALAWKARMVFIIENMFTVVVWSSYQLAGHLDLFFFFFIISTLKNIPWPNLYKKDTLALGKKAHIEMK